MYFHLTVVSKSSYLVIQYNYHFKKNDVATYKKQCNHAKYGHALQRTMNNKTNTEQTNKITQY